MSVAGIPLAIPSEERLRLYCSLLMDDTPVVNCATADDCLDTLGDVNSLGGRDRISLSCCRVAYCASLSFIFSREQDTS